LYPYFIYTNNFKIYKLYFSNIKELMIRDNRNENMKNDYKIYSKKND